MKKPLLLLVFLCLFATVNAQDQEFTQTTIRGQVTDKQTHSPLPGASIFVLDSNLLIGTSSDDNGYFTIGHVPIGRVSVGISYADISLPHLVT